MRYYRCDRCNAELTDDERQAPFIRLDHQIRAVATVMVFNDRAEQMNEICAACKTDIVLRGEPTNNMAIPVEYLRDQIAPPPKPIVAVLAAPIVREQIYESSKPEAFETPPVGFIAAEPQVLGELDKVDGEE